MNTFLWKRYRKQKQGILDVLVELNDHSKVNIELQIKIVKDWKKRKLFYLTKMFSGELLVGENYARLKRCVCISILDFNLDDSPKYHKVYRLRDEEGNEYTDMLEAHIIELGKTVNGTGRMDEWIRLFNAKTEEDLSMLQSQTKNPGILEAIREVKLMGLGRDLIALYDAHMKQVRDRNARDAYVYDEGVAAGRTEGEERKLVQLTCKKLSKGKTPETIAEELEEDLEVVKRICEVAQK